MIVELNQHPGYKLVIEESGDVQVLSSWGRGVPSYLGDINRNIPLTKRMTKFGYEAVDLAVTKDKRKTFHIHRLVAEHFIPNPDNLETVDHIDGNKLNNHPSNLQWMTREDNVLKAQAEGRWGTPPATYELTFASGEKRIITNVSEFGRENGYQASKIVAVSKGKRRFHKNIVSVQKLQN